MNRKLIAIVVTICMCALCSCSGKDTPKPAATGVNVSVFEAGSGSIESTVTYSGTLSASESVSVVAKVSAKADSVSVKEGDYVSAGDVLARLDDTDIRLSYEQALAAYESALAGYNSVVNSSSKQQKSQAKQALLSAQTAYDQAKANYEREKILYENASSLKLAEQSMNDAKAAYERTRQLFDMGGASQLELDSAHSAFVSAEENYKTVSATSSAAFDAAKTALTNAQNALNNAQENITLADNAARSSVETASASVNSARAALNIAQNSLSNTTITAPISGYVAVCNVSEGQMTAAGSVAFDIRNTSMVDAEINVTESVIPLIDVGTKALISIASANIENLEGAVTLVNPVKNDMTGLYTVKVSIDNADSAIKAGMLADITLTTASLDGIIKIPSKALINEGEDYYVYVAHGNVGKKVRVTTGVSDDEYTEITKGLAKGDKVIVDGKDYLSETNNEINITGNYEI